MKKNIYLVVAIIMLFFYSGGVALEGKNLSIKDFESYFFIPAITGLCLIGVFLLLCELFKKKQPL